ncbi:MAG: NEAT domain-containing protein, partial [Clostridiales Family XIII bacterium]|nr:NEAT domain-containing protein [Clostridiales Family XIII bacterium]
NAVAKTYTVKLRMTAGESGDTLLQITMPPMPMPQSVRLRLSNVSWVDTSMPVDIPDLNLKKALLDALNVGYANDAAADAANVTLNMMARLTELDASDRGVIDLTGLTKAVNLERLDLSGNPLDNTNYENTAFLTSLGEFNAFTKLKYLNLSDCGLGKGVSYGSTDAKKVLPIPRIATNIAASSATNGLLNKLPALEELDISDNDLYGTFILPTAANQTIQKIDLSGNRLIGINNYKRPYFKNLKEIDIADNYIDWDESANPWIADMIDADVTIQHANQKNLATLYRLFVMWPGYTSAIVARALDSSDFVVPDAGGVFDCPDQVGDTFEFGVANYASGSVRVTVDGEEQTLNGMTVSLLSNGINPLSLCRIDGLAEGAHTIGLSVSYPNGDTRSYTMKVKTRYLPTGASDPTAAGVRDAVLHNYVCAALGENPATYTIKKADMATLSGTLTLSGVKSLEGLQYATGLTRLTIDGTFDSIPDLSSLTALDRLSLDGLYSEVPNLPAGLTSLNIGSDNENLSIGALPASLTTLSVFGNVKVFPDISSLTELATFSLVDRALTVAPDLSHNTKIKTLVISETTGGALPNISALKDTLTALTIRYGRSGNWPAGADECLKLTATTITYYQSGMTVRPLLLANNKVVRFVIENAETSEEVLIDIADSNGKDGTWTIGINGTSSSSPASPRVKISGSSDTLASIIQASGNTSVKPPLLSFADDFGAPNVTSFTAANVDSGSFGLALATMSELITLNMGNSSIESVPVQVGLLTKLTTLTLKGSAVRAIDADLSACDKITALDATLTDIRSIDLDKMPPNLTTLNLSSSGLIGLTGEAPNLTKLITLNISGTQLSKFPEAIAKLTSLTTLTANHCFYGDIPANVFDGMTALRTVSLGDWVPVIKDELNNIVPLPGSLTEEAVNKLKENVPSSRVTYTTQSSSANYDTETTNYAGLTSIESSVGQISQNPGKERDLYLLVPDGTQSLTITPQALLADTTITVGGVAYTSGDTIPINDLAAGTRLVDILCANDFDNGLILVDKSLSYRLHIIVGDIVTEPEEGHYYQLAYTMRRYGADNLSMSNAHFNGQAVVRYKNGKFEVRFATDNQVINLGYFYPNYATAPTPIACDTIAIDGAMTTYRAYAATLDEPLAINMFPKPMGSYQKANMTFELSTMVDITSSMPGVDKTDLAAAIGNAENIKNTIYTDGSYLALQTAIAAAKVVNDDAAATEDEVDTALAALRLAIEDLEIDPDKLANKATLKTRLDDAKAIEKGKHTDTAWNILQAAIADATAVDEDIEATQKEVDAAANMLGNIITLFENSGESSALDKDGLADGTYVLRADMVKMDRNSKSMSDDAIDHDVILTVEDGKYYIIISFKGLHVEGFEDVGNFGYLSRLWYYDPVTYGSYGYPTGTAKDATVQSYQTNQDGSYVIDKYNNASNPYPKQVKFPLVDKANYENNDVPLRVFVPIMEAIAAESGTQDVLMRLDWTTLRLPGDLYKTGLSVKIMEAARIAQGSKSDAAYAALQSAITAARTVLDNSNSAQTEIDNAMSALAVAIAIFNSSADSSGTGNNNTAENNTGDSNNAGGNNNIGGDLTKSPATAIVTSLSTLTITAADKVWTGKKIATGFVLTAGGKKLTAGADYTITSTGANKNIGSGTVQIVGKGGYTGAVTVKFRIVPKAVNVKSVKVGKRSLTVKWAKAPKAEKITKYEVRWKVRGAKSWKSKAVSSAKASLAVKKLTKGKRYEVQARVYKTVGGTKYYSSWSKVRTSGKVK